MYLHIGGGRVVRDREILGCFDMDGKWDSDLTKEFLKAAERSGRTESAGEDLPRTFVLTDGGVIFTHISTAAIAGRGGGGSPVSPRLPRLPKRRDGGFSSP